LEVVLKIDAKEKEQAIKNEKHYTRN